MGQKISIEQKFVIFNALKSELINKKLENNVNIKKQIDNYERLQRQWTKLLPHNKHLYKDIYYNEFDKKERKLKRSLTKIENILIVGD